MLTVSIAAKRLSKTVNGKVTQFYYNGNVLSAQKSGNEVIYFMYDNNADIFGFIYNGTEYFYVKNAQNDVVAITDSTGKVIANYYYDDWGKLIETTGNTEIANLNPIRYRSYYYDGETGWYYLNTRYYSPEMSRFLNADGYVQTGQGMMDKNMFSYCENNPINRIDQSGMFWKEIGNWFKNKWNNVKTWASNTFGAGSSTYTTIAKNEEIYLSEPFPITAKSGIKTTQTVSKHGNSSKPVSVYAERDAEHPIKSSSAGIKFNISNFVLNISLGLDDLGIYASRANGDTINSFGLRINLSEVKAGFEGSSAVKWDNTTETTYANVSVNGWAIVEAYVFAATGQRLPSRRYAYA